MAAARLASLLIASADEGGLEEEGDGFVEGLGAHERRDIIAQLERQHATHAAPLLRALLKLPALRLDAAQAALHLIQSDRLSGKAAFLCLSELRMAIVLYWERREEQRTPTLRLSADSARAPPKKDRPPDLPGPRLEELLMLSESVLDSILGEGAGGLRTDGDLSATRREARNGPQQPAPSTSAAAIPTWGEGHGLAVQLLPPLLRAADAVNLEKCAMQVGNALRPAALPPYATPHMPAALRPHHSPSVGIVDP